MPSIHKDPRGKSPYWYCAYKLPNGKQVFKSTKQTDRAKAMEVCLALGRASGAPVRGELSEDHARRLLNEILEKAGAQLLAFRTVKDFFQEWLASKRLTKAPTTAARYSGIANDFLSFLGPRAEVSIGNISAIEVHRFRDREVRLGKTQSSANLALKTLRAVFNSARKQGIISNNPAEAVETFDADRECRDVFASEQVVSMLKVASFEWRGMILLGYYTGARISDCAQLRWSNVDLPNRLIRFSLQKTRRGNKRKEIICPVHEELEDYLLKIAAPDNEQALFPKFAEKATSGAHGLSRGFQRVMHKAGIYSEKGDEKTGRGSRFSKLGFHSLRHSFTSGMANAGVPQGATAKTRDRDLSDTAKQSVSAQEIGSTKWETSSSTDDCDSALITALKKWEAIVRVDPRAWRFPASVEPFVFVAELERQANPFRTMFEEEPSMKILELIKGAVLELGRRVLNDQDKAAAKVAMHCLVRVASVAANEANVTHSHRFRSALLHEVAASYPAWPVVLTLTSKVPESLSVKNAENYLKELKVGTRSVIKAGSTGKKENLKLGRRMLPMCTPDGFSSISHTYRSSQARRSRHMRIPCSGDSSKNCIL